MSEFCAPCALQEFDAAVSDFSGWLSGARGAAWALCEGCGWHLLDDQGRPACASEGGPLHAPEGCPACLSIEADRTGADSWTVAA